VILQATELISLGRPNRTLTVVLIKLAMANRIQTVFL